jgi:molybdopterin molybdotransferase
MTALLPVDEAAARVVAGVVPLESETVALGGALGRVLAAPLAARRTQPPFAASARQLRRARPIRQTCRRRSA